MKNKTFKITTKTIAYMAMFMALQVVLELAFKVVPGQPQGGSITLSLVPILLASYLLGGYYGIVVGACCCGLHFVLGLATYWGPWSLFLDYLIPLAVIGIASFFKNFEIKGHVVYPGIIVVMILKFISHYLSGAWLFGAYAPEGMNPWWYSFGYNLAYCLPTLIICYIGFVLIYPRLNTSIKL